MYYHRRHILPLLTLSALIVVLTLLVGCADDRSKKVKNGEVDLVLDDYRVTPQQIVSSGQQITFHVRNEGKQPHNLRFLRQGQWNYGGVKGLLPGQSTELTLKFKPDKYKMVSSLGNDEILGLYGTLFVKKR